MYICRNTSRGGYQTFLTGFVQVAGVSQRETREDVNLVTSSVASRLSTYLPVLLLRLTVTILHVNFSDLEMLTLGINIPSGRRSLSFVNIRLGYGCGYWYG